jgi:lysophospholipase L1-like esterase
MVNGLGVTLLRGLLVSQLTLTVVGCSASNSPSGSNGGASTTGGVSQSGGTSASAGGGSSNALGGTSASSVTTVSGGTSASANSGGSAAVGGTTANSATGGGSTAGGKTAVGGSNAAGGKTAVGGGSATGSGTAVGGGSATGGGTAVGGGSATGGASAPGSTSAPGGGSATGGSTSAPGGAPTSGGTTANGGGATATGGATAQGGTTATAGASSTSATHWVGTWTASPYVDTNANNTPPITSLSNSVIRQVTHVSLGGSQIRVQFSNLWGNGSLTINGAHIALCKATPSVDSTIDVTTDKALAFSGTASVTIAAGKEVWSDPIDFTVADQGNITITTSFGTVPSTLTQHSGSRTTSYFKAGGTTADLNAANMSSATSKALWFFISGIDVMADASAGGIVAVGDSITDGRGSDTDQNNRWTDILAARLQPNAPPAKISMMNQAIGATNVSGSAATSAQSRFARDVLGQSGVKYVIIFEGVNDIHGGTAVSTITAAYKDMIDRAHAHTPKLLVFGGTITPFGGSTSGSDPYYSATAEAARQQVNTYIKTAGNFDGVIDFDAAVTDGGNPPKLQTAYATWAQTDGLHPGPAGYKKMGDSVDLTLFTK